MKTITRALLIGAALMVPLIAGAKGGGGGKAVLVPAGDLKWKDDPDHAGVQYATVAGDPMKGAGKFFIKLPNGFSVPLHHHTPDHWGVVISGTLVQNVDGQDVTMPAGSYLSYTGKKQHTTKCTDPAGCLIFVDAHGKWDVVTEKTAAK
jgi:mannose-6-phosphate isomerase-like protein (cupin superfamily)